MKRSILWSVNLDELKLIVKSSNSFSDILKHFGLSNGCVIKTLKKVLIEKQISFSHIPEGQRAINSIEHLSIRQSKNKEKYHRYIIDWKSGDERGWTGKSFKVNNHIRRYFFDKYKNACQECGWSKINAQTGKVPLQIDHIDGNASNCRESNLRLLCPNCHALTPTFGRLNKITCRKHR
jgi:hypothetical protein